MKSNKANNLPAVLMVMRAKTSKLTAVEISDTILNSHCRKYICIKYKLTTGFYTHNFHINVYLYIQYG